MSARSFLPGAHRFHTEQDNIELTKATEDMAGLFERNDVGSILRGAVLSTSLAMDVHYPTVVSTLSSLFKLPVDAIQRARDHGKGFVEACSSRDRLVPCAPWDGAW